MSLVLLFSGQGSQHPEMLSWLDGRQPLLQDLRARLGGVDWRQALLDPAWAECNRHAQLLLTGVALAAWQQLAPQLPAPVAVAGYSVGELAACAAAGVFEAGTALELAERRARAMDQAALQQPGRLLALSGCDEPGIARLCAAHGLSVAIRLELDAAVLGGPPPALAEAARVAEAMGARCTPLKIALASHTPAMQPAAQAFAEVLATQALAAPRCALYANVGERVQDAAQVRRALAEQIATTVQWSATLDALAERRPRCVLEIGPGAALAAMWNRRHPAVPARSADEFRSARSLVDWVKRRLGG